MPEKILKWVPVAVFAAVMLLVGTMTAVTAESPFKPIPASEVDQAQRDKARRIAAATLKGWSEGKFEPLSDDFTSEMKKALTPAAQRNSYLTTKPLFGDFRDQEFVEAVASPNLPEYVLYRFRGTFSGTKEKPEIRVVINGEGKVAGFWIKHWRKEVM